MPTFSPGRAAFVLVIIASCLLGMTGRVAYLQTYGRQKTIHLAERQQHRVEQWIARRGSVFDRNGILLAGTVKTLALYADPKFMQREWIKKGGTQQQLDAKLGELAGIIGCEPGRLTKLIADRAQTAYVKIVENLDEKTCDAIDKLDIPGLGLEPMSDRYYPNGSLAAHILGTVGRDGTGLEGLEMKFNKELAGKNGSKVVLKDARRRDLEVDAEDFVPPAHGKHLVLTIDSNIQMIVEEELAASCQAVHAASGEVVVMNPLTGEVLALANYPTFNPQEIHDAAPEARRNNAIVTPYEPGSTLKPFIMGPALSWGETTLTHVWPIPGQVYIPYGSRHVTDVHFYGPLCSWDVLVKSSNIGMSLLGEKLGNAKLYRALSSFGYGRRTGIELAGEDPGLLHPLAKWTHFSTESVAQGYEMMVTPLQLARGFCAYANGGRLVTPHIIQGALDPDGEVRPRLPVRAPETFPQVIEPEAAAQVRRALSDVVIRGTAAGFNLGRSHYYNIFGKTGTAHISRGKGYASDKYTSSFIGGAPVENPKLVVVMIIHEPDRAIAHYGGKVSAPGARNILDRALSYMQVPPSPQLEPPGPEISRHLYNFNPKLYGADVVLAE